MHLSGATSHSLYWIVWEAVRRLEEMNLKVGYCVALSILLLYYIIQVMAFVCDSVKPNRKFLKSLGIDEHMKNGIAYKTVNRYCRDRFIYFICDVPHLIKTTRNCWYSSTMGGTRCMWVCVTLCFDV